MKHLSLSLLALLSLQAMAAPKCQNNSCVGDRIMNNDPVSENEIFGRIDDIKDYTYIVTWDSGRVAKTNWVTDSKLYRECVEHELEKICKGDRTLLQGNTGEDNLYYVDFLGGVENGNSEPIGLGKIVGTKKVIRMKLAGKKLFQDYSTVYKKGPVPGFEKLNFGEEIPNKFGSKDIVVASAGGKYFVYLGDKGVARDLFKKDLALRLNLKLTVDPQASIIGKKCPDFRGEYVDLGCTHSDQKRVKFWPYSYGTRLSSKRIIVEQTGCDIVQISYDLSWPVKEDSRFSSGAEGLTSQYDLKKAKFKGSSASIHISESDFEAGGPSECLPVPYAYYSKYSQDYQLSLEGNTLTTKAKFSDFGISFIVPSRISHSSECKMTRIP